MKLNEILAEEFKTDSAKKWFKDIVSQYHETGNPEDEKIVKQINMWRDSGQDFQMQRAYFSFNRKNKKGFDEKGRPKVRKKRTTQKIDKKTAHEFSPKSNQENKNNIDINKWKERIVKSDFTIESIDVEKEGNDLKIIVVFKFNKIKIKARKTLRMSLSEDDFRNAIFNMKFGAIKKSKEIPSTKKKSLLQKLKKFVREILEKK